MVLDKKETAVAYRCPECGASVMSMVGVFTLTADLIRLKCPCGASQMEIIYTKDNKIRLNVPCFICPYPHSYLISSQIFFNRELLAFSCGTSGIDICFVGLKEQVEEAMKKSEEELLELVGDTDIKQLSEHINESHELFDPQIMETVLYAVQELADEEKIICGCGHDGDYDFQVHSNYLKIQCKKCGRSLDIRTDSLLTATSFLESDKIELQ